MGRGHGQLQRDLIEILAAYDGDDLEMLGVQQRLMIARYAPESEAAFQEVLAMRFSDSEQRSLRRSMQKLIASGDVERYYVRNDHGTVMRSSCYRLTARCKRDRERSQVKTETRAAARYAKWLRKGNNALLAE